MGQVKLPISHWAAEDRPSYKVGDLGTNALTTAELLSIVIGSGSAGMNAIEVSRELLIKNDNSLRRLFALKPEQLSQFRGVGAQKASKILAALELGKRLCGESLENTGVMFSATEIFKYMRPRMYGLDTEDFWVLYCNQSYRLIKAKKMFSGGLTETVVDLRLIFKEALMCNTTTFFCVHNHPSGRVNPSKQDDMLTQQIKKAADFMRLHFADHVIIGDNTYYSYHENGRL